MKLKSTFEWAVSRSVYTTKEWLDLKKIVEDNVTIKVYNAYKGMAEFNYKKFISNKGRSTVKKYLYVELNKYFRIPSC